MAARIVKGNRNANVDRTASSTETADIMTMTADLKR
jgi:hypothetical protein